jgi:hypothetical protein
MGDSIVSFPSVSQNDLNYATNDRRYPLGYVVQAGASNNEYAGIKKFMYVQAHANLAGNSFYSIVASAAGDYRTATAGTFSIISQYGVTGTFGTTDQIPTAGQYFFIQIAGLCVVTSTGNTTLNNAGTFAFGSNTITDEASATASVLSVGYFNASRTGSGVVSFDLFENTSINVGASMTNQYGQWRIIVNSDGNLSFDKLESGTWNPYQVVSTQQA